MGLVLLCCLPVVGAGQEAAVSTVSFNFLFEGSQPEHYLITVPSQGNAHYLSEAKVSPAGEGDPFRMDFSISDSVRGRVFDLAKLAHYFSTDIDSKKKGLASTGVKTLTYKDGDKTWQGSYNYSSNTAVQELTNLFQNLSSTLEFASRLDYYHRYQKLALDDELKRMEEMAKRDSLEDLAAIAPILQQIAGDASLINPVRTRAQRLLALAGVEQ